MVLSLISRLLRNAGHPSVYNGMEKLDVLNVVEGASANFYSLVMTCRANNINLYYYFAHLFKVLRTRTPQYDLTNFPIDEA